MKNKKVLQHRREEEYEEGYVLFSNRFQREVRLQTENSISTREGHRHRPTISERKEPRDRREKRREIKGGRQGNLEADSGIRRDREAKGKSSQGQVRFGQKTGQNRINRGQSRRQDTTLRYDTTDEHQMLHS
jgi:hypothetical protein